MDFFLSLVIIHQCKAYLILVYEEFSEDTIWVAILYF